MSEMVLTQDELNFMREAAEYIDTHDMSEELKSQPEVHFDVSGAKPHYYYEVEPELRQRLCAIARQRGISAEALLNQWVQEKAAESLAVGAAE